MELIQVMEKLRQILIISILVLSLGHSTTASSWEYDVGGNEGASYYLRPHIVPLAQERVRRDAAVPPPAPTAAAPAAPGAAPAPADPTVPPKPANGYSVDAHNETITDNHTTNKTVTDATEVPPAVVVTRIPLLGQNGTGILKVDLTAKQPRVSDPIVPDDNLTETVFSETPEKIKAEQNITDLKYDNHDFYNSSFIGNLTYFNEHWANITSRKPDIHPILSNSHRRATTIKLGFEFPFYGHPVRNITVATGGFIYTGDHVHNWLAATQYIAPLMANFDTTLTNESLVKLYEDEEKFTALWENVTLQEERGKSFTFAVTLYRSGDIVFAYKHVPMPIEKINSDDHPVKVGISDAYLTDRILFYVRRKTIYEYHRVSFRNHEIESGTLLRLVALPTCNQYSTCEGCVNHETGFNCTWCEQIHKCSSGTDRNKQDWMLRNCEKSTIWNATSCPAPASGAAGGAAGAAGGNNTNSYFTDGQVGGAAVVNTDSESTVQKSKTIGSEAAGLGAGAGAGGAGAGGSAAGGAAAAVLAALAAAGLAAWMLYAFKNPHTRSGQLLIKYRPSQWSWKRGEARYTAATIHM